MILQFQTNLWEVMLINSHANGQPQKFQLVDVIRVLALLENEGKLKNNVNFKASQGNSGKCREVFVLKAINQRKSGNIFVDNQKYFSADMK